MARLSGKTALITGGTSGIGRNATLRFVREGARVLFTGRDKARADETLAEIEELGGEGYFEPHDVTSEADWQRVIAAAESHLGSLDVLVNNAGIFSYGPIEDTTPEDFQKMWSVNVDGVFLGIKYGLSLMKKNPRKGSIVNISSLSGMVGHADVVSYCTTKAASIMMTRTAAMEAAPHVRVNALAPGPVWNELLEREHAGQDAEETKEYYKESQPLKLLGESADVTNGIVYLASEESRFVTGSILRIDAGRGAD
ncbi:MAG: SDR family NAD(P)-dependent oxidoreductase [Pseudomonadales bacterium]